MALQISGRVNCNFNVNVNVKCSFINTVNANVNVNGNVILEAQTQYIGGKFYYCQQAGPSGSDGMHRSSGGRDCRIDSPSTIIMHLLTISVNGNVKGNVKDNVKDNS